MIPQKTVHKYLRHNKKFPHVWCPGCSNGIVLGAIIRAIEELEDFPVGHQRYFLTKQL